MWTLYTESTSLIHTAVTQHICQSHPNPNPYSTNPNLNPNPNPNPTPT